MYKKTIIPLLTIILGMLCCGCDDSSQANTEFGGGFIAEIETEKDEKVPLSDDIDVEGTPLGPWYASERQILPAQDPVTRQGITYQLLSYEQTKEFGNRNPDTLSEIVDVDSDGNLTDDATYVFVTLRITNETESAITVARTGSIIAIEPDMEIKFLCAEAVYVDEYWTGGSPSSVFFYELAGGESITCEVGYQVPDDAIENHTLYYEFESSDDLGDPDNRFCKLEDLQ